MALQNFVYRLKPQLGDSAPHDELSLAGTLSGGSIALVDMGSGDYAWSFSGVASAVGPTHVCANDATGSGFTMAIRLGIQTYDSSSYAYLAGWGTDVALAHALVIGQNGTNNVRARYLSVSPDTLALLPIHNVTRTIIVRSTISNGAMDKVHAWVNGLSGSGDTADYISNGANNPVSGDLVFDTIFLGSSGSVIKVADYVLWNEELSDADCHALAETGIRATLDSVGANGTAAGGTGLSTGSGSGGTAAGGSVGSGTAPGGTGSSTGSGSGGIASGATAGSRTITIPAIKDLTTGGLRASQTGVTVIVNDQITGALVVKKTGQATDASGNCAVTDAALVAATTYRVTTILADGSEGTWKYTAA